MATTAIFVRTKRAFSPFCRTMLDGHEIVVVVPAFEEAPRIGRVIGTMPPFVDRIVVVDDASHDATADAARRAGDARVEVVVHGENRGVGAAIVTGYRRTLDVVSDPRAAIAVMAGDGQMHPDDLASLVGPIVHGEADYAKGDRFAWSDAARAMPLQRRVGGRVFSWLTTHAIGVAISDSQCGYTALSRAACARLDLDTLWPGYGYPNDLLSQLALRGMRIAHVPVRAVYADEISRLRLRHLGRIGWLCARAYARRVRAS
jgi:glycosyltransferase involved in cell wall biosynthesis